MTQADYTDFEEKMVTLYPHQVVACRRMKEMEESGKGGVLADEMGLGKTLSMISHLKANKIEGVRDLIVCPLSLLPHWEEEIHKLYGNEKVSIVRYHGPGRREKLSLPCDYVLTTYGILGRAELAYMRWGRVVLDEAHYIKNGIKKSKPPLCATNAYRLYSKFKWCITGTPFNNRMSDIASLCKFIGTEPYNDPIWWKNQSREKIQEWRGKYLIRATKEGLLAPPKYHTLEFDPSPKEKKVIDAMRMRAKADFEMWKRAHGYEKIRLQGKLLGLIMKLRQISDSYQCPDGVETAAEIKEVLENSSKVQQMIYTLKKGIEEDPTSSVVVFSQFTTFLRVLQKVIGQVMPDVEILQFDGSMSSQSRDRVVRRFRRATNKRVLLVSLMAGGVGLNLTPCSTVLIAEPWYNPFVEKQAEERVHRLGQKNQVTIYRFIMNNSVETWIELLKKRKLLLAANMELVKTTGDIKEFNLNDITSLFQKHVTFGKEEEKKEEKS